MTRFGRKEGQSEGSSPSSFRWARGRSRSKQRSAPGSPCIVLRAASKHSTRVPDTPDLTSALDGITRNTIMQLAADIGLDVLERRITRDAVYIADEAFFSGTAAEVTPIREVDNRLIGAGSRGPITEKLQSMYFDVVAGKNDRYSHCLTYV